jgi:6-phosphogluconolactonase
MQRTVPAFLGVALALSVIFPTLGKAEPREGNAAKFAVFVMTNSAEKNEVIAFTRAEDGHLEQGRTFDTGGRGSGGITDPLASQGSLTLSEDRTLLFAVNAGSGDITVFHVNGSILTRVDRVASGGSAPNAIAQHGNLVFVLNSGGGSNVVGFQLESNGKLRRIAHSSVFLTTNSPGAGSLGLSPDGRVLLVTEKATNRIDAFNVDSDGSLRQIVVNPSTGPGLFAISFAPSGVALASETGPAGGNNASAISSYAVGADGKLFPLSSSVPTFGAATCWQAITPDGRFVYTSNSGTSTISAFEIEINGTLASLPGTVVGTLPPGATNLDLAISSDGKYLYTLNSGSGSIGTFLIHQDGTLSLLGEVGALTASGGLNGIAAN